MMSPKGRANQTSWKPKEGKRFSRQIKVSLHDSEMRRIAWLAAANDETPAEWAREAVRQRLDDVALVELPAFERTRHER